MTTPEGDLPIVRLTHWGRWVSAAVILGILVALGFAFADAEILWADIPAFFTSEVMIEGLGRTLGLAVAAQVGAILIGVVIALLGRSANPVARWFAVGYIWIFRGLPVLLQILIWYNLALVFPVISIPFADDVPTNAVINVFVAALLGLGLNESAYMAEIIRAGLNSVDRGQLEAAKAIGMTPATTLTRVTLPQAMRVIIPPTGNDFINMLKGTSIASVIPYVELTKAAGNIASRNLEFMETLLAAAAWYMILVSIASVGQYYLERSFDAADRVHRVRTKVGRSLLTLRR
ncbi:MAG: amino acid ABC transporter permease [Kibdelosporangium sp.]